MFSLKKKKHRQEKSLLKPSLTRLFYMETAPKETQAHPQELF